MLDMQGYARIPSIQKDNYESFWNTKDQVFSSNVEYPLSIKCEIWGEGRAGPFALEEMYHPEHLRMYANFLRQSVLRTITKCGAWFPTRTLQNVVPVYFFHILKSYRN